MRLLRLLHTGWRRHWRGIVAALAALAGLVLISLGPALFASVWDIYSEHRQQGGNAHRVGQPVRDGQVTFVVHQARCGADAEAVNGWLCEITVEARNVGDEEIEVPTAGQTLRVAEGARHQPTGDTRQFGTLAPAEATTTVLRFDLPHSATITYLELRAGTYAEGVPVAIGEPLSRPPPG